MNELLKKEYINKYNEYIYKLKNAEKNGQKVYHIPTIEEYYCNIDLEGEKDGEIEN